MATKERYQNPVPGDTANLRMFSFNSNAATSFDSIERVDIYFLDRAMITGENPDGRRLVASFGGSDVTEVAEGEYLLNVELEELKYVIGTYIDSWIVVASDDQPAGTIEQVFRVYPNLWYTTPIPVVYDFDFHFQPNKLRKGSKQFLIVEIIPNVPTAGDLRQYYENMAIVSDLKISMEQVCGDCMPAERDLRLILDKETVPYREKRYGFYQLDTEDMECGLYDIWFQLELGTNVYVSDRLKFQIYD